MILLTVFFLNYLRYDYSGEESNNNVSSSAARANTSDSAGMYKYIWNKLAVQYIFSWKTNSPDSDLQ